jgi:nucleoside-diphosphate-sugar epimerase
MPSKISEAFLFNYPDTVGSSKLAIITGGSGYIAGNIALKLEEFGWDVVLLLRSKSDIGVNKALKKTRYHLYDGSAKSLRIFSTLDKDKTVFIHVAASIELRDEIEKFDQILNGNIKLGIEIASFMVQHGFRKLIFTESYWQFNEDGTLGGNSLYAASKSSFSLLLEYLSKYYLTVDCLVLYDVFGPNDKREKLINSLIENASRANRLDMTEGNQILDYIYIDDVVNAFHVAAQKMIEQNENASFNRYAIRSMVSMTLRNYVDLIEEILGCQFDISWGTLPYPPYQIMRPWLPGLDRLLPGWRPSIKFQEGIKNLICHES